MVTRWSNYIADGTFRLSVPEDTPLGGKGGKGRLAEFWTTSYPYWDMKERDQELWDDLRNSSLVIFKVRIKMTCGSSPDFRSQGDLKCVDPKRPLISPPV